MDEGNENFSTMKILYPYDLLFQPDNFKPHTTRQTTKCLDDIEINVLKWPALSPDLIPAEDF